MFKHLKKIFIAFLLLYYKLTLFSQNQFNNNYYVSFTTRYGFIFPHRPSIAYLVKKHIPAFDLCISKQMNYKSWHSLYKYPYAGIGFYHSDLGNPLYTGKSFAFYGFLDFPLLQSQVYSFNFSVALGLAYLTNYYDENHNYYNLVISTPINAYVDFGLIHCFYFKHLRINAGIAYTHYSNGAISKPNLGFNIPSAKISIGYFNQRQVFKKENKEIPTHIAFYEIHFLLAGGIRQNSTSDPYNYFANTFAINIEKHISAKRSIGIGLDFFYDPSIPQRNNFSYEKPYTPYLRAGIHLSHDWILNRLNITFQTGRYFFDKLNLDGKIYSRVGLKYKINSHLQANMLLKSHFAKADIIEFGASYYITKHQIFKIKSNN